MKLTQIAAVFIVVLLAGCGDEPIAAPAEVTSIDPREAGGSVLEITITNPLETSSDAECTVEAPGPGNTFTLRVSGIRPSGEKTIRTNLPDLDPQTSPRDINLACEISP